jgi:hypothetical protein
MALDELLTPPPTVVLRGPAAAVRDWAARLARLPAPGRLVLPLDNDQARLPGALDKPTSTAVNAWLCSGVSCQAPITDFTELGRVLQAA